jgi:hypothetical protein
MAKHDPNAFNERWHADRNRSWLSLDISVDDVQGTSGVMIVRHHYGTAKQSAVTLARVSTEDRDKSQEALMEVLGQLLVLHANRVQRAAELGSQAY